MNTILFKFIIDFEDKRKLQRNMNAETEEEVFKYISEKYKTTKFKITKGQEIGVIIK